MWCQKRAQVCQPLKRRKCRRNGARQFEPCKFASPQQQLIGKELVKKNRRRALGSVQPNEFLELRKRCRDCASQFQTSKIPWQQQPHKRSTKKQADASKKISGAHSILRFLSLDSEAGMVPASTVILVFVQSSFSRLLSRHNAINKQGVRLSERTAYSTETLVRQFVSLRISGRRFPQSTWRLLKTTPGNCGSVDSSFGSQIQAQAA